MGIDFNAVIAQYGPAAAVMLLLAVLLLTGWVVPKITVTKLEASAEKLAKKAEEGEEKREAENKELRDANKILADTNSSQQHTIQLLSQNLAVFTRDYGETVAHTIDALPLPEHLKEQGTNNENI